MIYVTIYLCMIHFKLKIYSLYIYFFDFLGCGFLWFLRVALLWSHWLFDTSFNRSHTFCVVAYVLFNLLTMGWILSEQCSASIPTVFLRSAFSGTWYVKTWNFLIRLEDLNVVGNQQPRLAHLTFKKQTSCLQRGLVTPQNVITRTKCNTNAKCNTNWHKM